MLNYSSKSTNKSDSIDSSLIGWITNLQGTGDSQLNDIVNELTGLRYQIGASTRDENEINQSVTRLQRKVKSLVSNSKSLHNNCLREIEKGLQNITTQ